MTGRRVLSITLFVAAGAAVLVGFASGSGSMERKIDMMEKIFDTAMIESENALVRQGKVTRGIYLPGRGVFLTLQFTFVDRPGRKAADYLDNIDSLKVYWREMIGLNDEEESQAGLRRRGQLNTIVDELSDVLIEYGGTVTTLDGSEWIEIAAFPWQENWPVSPKPVRALTIRGRFDDLRAFAEGRISDDEIRERIEIAEVDE